MHVLGTQKHQIETVFSMEIKILSSDQLVTIQTVDLAGDCRFELHVELRMAKVKNLQHQAN